MIDLIVAGFVVFAGVIILAVWLIYAAFENKDPKRLPPPPTTGRSYSAPPPPSGSSRSYSTPPRSTNGLERQPAATAPSLQELAARVAELEGTVGELKRRLGIR